MTQVTFAGSVVQGDGATGDSFRSSVRPVTAAEEGNAVTADRRALLRSLYDAFNARDVDTVIAAMSPDVDWPNGWQGGRVVGHDAVRDYWQRQWAEIRPSVRPTTVADRDDGRIEVAVHQVVRDPSGSILAIADVRHVYAFDDGDLVTRMDIED